MCHVPNIEQAYVVSMPNHNPDRQGHIITGSDINITGKGKFYLDLFLVFLEGNPIWTHPDGQRQASAGRPRRPGFQNSLLPFRDSCFLSPGLLSNQEGRGRKILCLWRSQGRERVLQKSRTARTSMTWKALVRAAAWSPWTVQILRLAQRCGNK